MNNAKGQQEIVGFVLIVALVMVALMIFLIISINKPEPELRDSQIDNMLSVMMAYTTECAPNYVPNYDKLDELIGDCYENEQCQNLGKGACESLNKTINEVMANIMRSESEISAYQIKIFRDDNETSEEILPPIREGNCTGEVRGSSRDITNSIIVELRLCYPD